MKTPASRTTMRLAILATILSAQSTSAFAVGATPGLAVFTTLNTWLVALGSVVLTTSFMWSGYKMLFKGARIEEISGPLIGGIIFGAAPLIAGLVMSLS